MMIVILILSMNMMTMTVKMIMIVVMVMERRKGMIVVEGGVKIIHTIVLLGNHRQNPRPPRLRLLLRGKRLPHHRLRILLYSHEQNKIVLW